MRRIIQVVLLALALVPAACGAPATGAPPTALPAPPGGSAQPTAPTAAPAPTAKPTTPPEPTAAPTTPPAVPPAPTAAPKPTAKPAAEAGAPAGVLAIYHKSGGIMGLDQTLTVYADGKIELKGRTGSASGQAPEAQLDALSKLLASADFAGLKPEYRALGADLFTYQVSVPGTGRTVVTMDGAQTPEVLGQAIAALEELVKLAK